MKHVIPAQAGIQITDKHLKVEHGRKNSNNAGCSIDWIPACAGMTTWVNHLG